MIKPIFFSKESMKTVGCTTPYGLNLDHICTDLENAEKAWKIYEREHSNTSCSYPCSYLGSFLSSKNTVPPRKGKRELLMTFKEYIKNHTSTCTYSGLDLFAAVGGYLGLFLGGSILNISNVVSSIIKKLIRN